MRRSEYIKTKRGQRTLLNCRSANIIYVTVEQEPKSKKSIAIAEKIEFQRKVIQDMGSRRAFQNAVALEIEFISTQNDPPAIQTLAKNYLDLLGTPLPEVNTRWKQILYKDDSQIKFLSVNYHIDREGRRKNRPAKPSIRLTVRPMRDLLGDLSLLERIKNDDFGDDNIYCRRNIPLREKLSFGR